MKSFGQVWRRPRNSSSTVAESALTEFPDGVKIWHSPTDAEIDICFIHGLSGNRDKTWAAHGQHNPWPAELLPSRLAKARLLTYGYDAYVVKKSVSSTNRLIDHANNLLHDLAAERAPSGIINRPLIFIVHSFGGIVCKTALIISRQSPESHLGQIYKSTRGIAFLGTPHRGSWAADWAKIPAWVLGQVKSTNRNILDVLQINNQYLEFIQTSFLSMIRELRETGRPLHITCFFEELPLPGFGAIVNKESASLEGYSAFSIHANHSDMVKFGSAEESGFKRLLGELVRWDVMLGTGDSTASSVAELDQFHGDVNFVGGNGDSGKEGRKAQVLKRLATSPYRDRKDRNPSAVQGTCEWFISHHLYHEWLGQEASKILWVSADPGCGKSVLVKHLIDSIIQTTDSRIISYFFFKDDFTDQKSLLSAFSCILQQLFLQDTTLLSDEILLQFDANGQWIIGSFVELWQILIKVAASNSDKEIICLIDAVDECNEHERNHFFKALCELYGSKKSPNLKFLITSRPYREIGMGFKPLENLNLPVIHLSGESDAEMGKIVKEIDIAIRQRVSSIGVQQKLTDDEQGILVTRLLCVRNRTYLWAHLTLDLIERQLDINKEKIIDITSHLPHNVNEAYERILCRTFSTEKATRMLHLILAAKRPLTLGEMIVALELQQHHQSIDDIELEPEDRFRDKIRDICGLVTVNESRIFLLHQTVKEFLISMDHSEPASPSSLSWKHSILANDPNMTLTSVCVWCLLLNHPRKDQYTAVPPPSTHTKKNAFISYAAKHWANHFNRLSAHNQKKMTSVALEICDARGSCFLSWFPVYWRSRHARVVAGFTTLMAASYFGLEVVVRRILKTDYSQLNKKDETYHRSALSWAAGNGHDGVVKRLIRGLSIGPRTLKIVLRQGAKINEFDSDNRTPLTYAIWNRHLSVVRRLVEAGAWVDVPDVLGGTPTSYAVTSGNFKIQNLVLRGDVPSNAEHNEGEKLLLSASNGIIKLLLEHKADVNTRDKTGMTPLHFATRYGQFEIAKLILQTGCADVNIPDLAGLTPLHLAARWKQDDIAQLILRTGMANVTARVNDQGPVYSWVIRYNSCSTLKLMLDLYDDPSSFQDCTMAILETDWDWSDKLEVMVSSRKVDMNVSDTHGETVLHKAVIKRSYKMIRELLASGKAPINSRNSRGLTPLAQACLIMDLDIVSAFLETDLWDLNIADSYGNTPLHHAIQARSVPITSALIATGKAGVAMKNKDGRTPLSLACLDGNTSLVKYLLDNSQADINTQDIYGRTPVHNCIWMEDVDMLRLILQTGRAKLNVVDKFQCTPLLLAAYQSKWHMASLLLNYKQAVNMKGQKGRTVIFWAIIQGQTETVRQLISLEQTNLAVRDEEGFTPLSHAAQQGNEEIIRVLLSKPGIEVDAKDNAGMTALGHAAKQGHLGAVELLLNEGKANSWIKDKEGRTPLALASAEGHFKVVQRILF
ncbi:hypothetical protein FOVSG1_003019 [Fusarium oxysporum f. sp. vasinfectum]